METSLELNGENGHILITVLGYENDSAQTESDANWLKCEIKIVVPCFYGAFPANFTVQDFQRFHKELKSAICALDGQAEFHCDEEQLDLVLKFSKRNVHVSGMAKCMDYNSRLHFEIESDFSSVNLAFLRLESILKKFPEQRR
jgi:hypothetical protein